MTYTVYIETNKRMVIDDYSEDIPTTQHFFEHVDTVSNVDGIINIVYGSIADPNRVISIDKEYFVNMIMDRE